MSTLGLFWTISSTGTAISGALSSIMPSSIRMVRFVRALAGDPEMILADEPTAALDFQARRIIMETMRDLVHDRGRGGAHRYPTILESSSSPIRYKSLRERNYDFGESEERGMIILRRPNK